MKRLLSFFMLFVVTVLAHAAPYELRWTQRDAADALNFTRQVIPITPTTSAVLMYDGNTTLPKMGAIGPGLSWDGVTLSATGSGSQVNADWNAASGVAQILNKPSLSAVATSGNYSDLLGRPTLFSGAYADLTGKPALFDGTWASLTGKPTTFAPSAHTHAASDITSGTLDDARIPALAISKTTGLQAALDAKFTTPTGSTAQYVRGDGSLAAFPTVTARSFSYTIRALNACFQPSATRDTLVTYSVDIATSLSLTTGQQGTVYLRTYTNSGCSTGAQEITRFVNGQTGTLTIGLALTQNVTGTLTGVIPAGSWVQLVTENNTGTPTFTARPGQEVGL